MKLTYRGIKYNPQNPSTSQAHNVNGKYRGKAIDVVVADRFESNLH
ncbi:MAG: DUF4278 domain-containing protein [Elainellaceae cyanobacterium]